MQAARRARRARPVAGSAGRRCKEPGVLRVLTRGTPSTHIGYSRYSHGVLRVLTWGTEPADGSAGRRCKASGRQGSHVSTRSTLSAALRLVRAAPPADVHAIPGNCQFEPNVRQHSTAHTAGGVAAGLTSLRVLRVLSWGTASPHMGYCEYTHGVLRVITWGTASNHMGYCE